MPRDTYTPTPRGNVTTQLHSVPSFHWHRFPCHPRKPERNLCDRRDDFEFPGPNYPRLPPLSLAKAKEVMSGPCVLFEVKNPARGLNPFIARFEDLDGRAAFTMHVPFPS